jgi:hypothetical protein
MIISQEALNFDDFYMYMGLQVFNFGDNDELYMLLSGGYNPIIKD